MPNLPDVLLQTAIIYSPGIIHLKGRHQVRDHYIQVGMLFGLEFTIATVWNVVREDLNKPQHKEFQYQITTEAVNLLK